MLYNVGLWRIRYVFKIVVNHHTYLEGLTCRGTVACVKRLPERAEVEIELYMDRLTNSNNSLVGMKFPY